MEKLISLKKSLCLCLLIISYNLMQASILPFNARISTASPANPVTIGLATATTLVQVTTPWTGSFVDAAVINRITLGVDHENTAFVTLAGDIKVKLQIEQWSVNNTTAIPNLVTPQELTINYQPFSNTVPYIDKSVFSFNNAYKYRITIVAITQNGTPITTLPKNLFIDADILVERYVDFTTNSSTPIIFNLIASTDIHDLNCDAIFDELVLSWKPMAGAEEYHLEWTFVNDYDKTLGAYVAPSTLPLLPFDFKNNSTRITTTDTKYTVTLNFEHGYLLYRVRAIGRSLANPKQDIVGVWNVDHKGFVVTLGNQYKYHNTQEHEGNKNWQYSATYAEEGKKKEVISYFDGGLRNRQSVTKVNSDKNTIVGQTIYDFQGRPAINVLPVPVNDPTCITATEMPLKYYPKFNRNEVSTAGNLYSRDDFDVDGTDSCSSKTGPMNTVSGASNYYSPLNPKQNGAQAFVPDGEKYPFTQVEYTPDNTGRISRQGGVGPKYQLDKNHETKYFYGSPNQIQLDRLFGSEVGDAGHYKKNIVIDANGQVSVSYLDQEGRTITTSLAGNAPKLNNTTILAPLDSESSAVKDLTIDLFSKNALGVSSVNTKNIQGDALVFNSQLLVAYESEYTFEYDLSINQMTDPCLKDNICFNCVYDLEVKITDDCGKVVTTMTGIHPVNKTIGQFKQVGSTLVFRRECSGAIPFTHNESFKLNLPVGNYTISKILTVNSAARDFYVKTFLDSTYNGCAKTLFDFQQEALSKIDTSNCNITCGACDTSLRTINGVFYSDVKAARDAFVAAGFGTELSFDYLLEECGAPCKTLTWCEATYQQLLMDVSPDGQYAQFQNTIGGQAPDLALSVLYKGNILPKSLVAGVGNELHWQKPLINVNGTNYAQYLEEDGTRSIIAVRLNGTNWIPSVINNSVVKHDPVTNSDYVYPQELSDVQDFVNNWQGNWAKSLVQYHPEYCYYESCSKYSVVQTGDSRTSDDFDELLLQAKTYQAAVTANLILPTYPTTPIFPANTDIKQIAAFVYSTSAGIVKDPFLTSYGTYGLSLPNRVTNFQTIGLGTYSMIEVAAMTARCGTNYGTNPISAPCISFGKIVGTDPNKALDQEWNLLKNFYLSEKRKVQQQLADEYARQVCKSYNGCIGDSTYNPFTSGIYNLSGGSVGWINSWNNNVNQPCSMFYYGYYIGKKKRFIGPNDIKSPSTDEMDYQAYLQTGQCPLAIDLQYFISALASNNKLDNTTGENLQVYGEFTNDLYTAVSGGTVPSTFVPYAWKATLTSPDIITASFVNTLNNAPVCGVILNKTGAGIANWADIISLNQLKFTVISGINYEFTATAAILNPNNSISYKTIKGFTCLKITGCTFPPQCTANDLAKDLSALMSALQINGQLLNLAPVILNTTPPPYQLFLTSAIKNALGTTSSNLLWRSSNGTNQFELYEIPAKKLVIKFTTVTGNLAAVKYFTDIKSNYQNFFTLKGNDASNLNIVTIDGSVELVASSTNTGLSMGSCGLPKSLSCQGNEYQLRDDLQALLYDVLLKKGSIDLTLSPYYTKLIQSFFPNGLTNTSSINPKNNSTTYAPDSLVFTIRSNQDSCKMLLVNNSKGIQQSGYFKDLIGFEGALTPYPPTAADNNYYKFYFIGIYSLAGQTFKDTIWGESCLPLQFCEPCSEAPKTNCTVCEKIIVIPPVDICRNRLATFKFETKGCSPNPNLLWNFGDGTALSSSPTHTYAAAGNYTVTLSTVRTVACQGLKTTVGSVNIKVKDCLALPIGERPMEFDSIAIAKSKVMPIIAINDSTCKRLYALYLTAIANYNASKYANIRNHTLKPYPNYGLFVERYCLCAEKYIAYLQQYLIASPSLNLPLPVDIERFEGCNPPAPVKDTCKDAYTNYLTAVNQYNGYVKARPNLGLPFITNIYKDSAFTATGFCYCIKAYSAFLQTIVNGTADLKDRTKLIFYLDIANICRELITPPCVPVLQQDTFISPAYVPYTNPCVQYQFDIAYLNAANAYHQYIDSLTTVIAAKYNAHCLKAFESFSAKYKDKEYHFTLYYYDQAGNLVKTVPPEGVDLIDMPDTLDADYVQINRDRTFNRHTYFTNHRMATTYLYNSLNQLVRQSMPDHDSMDIWDFTIPNGLDTRLKVTATQFVTSTKGFLSGYIDMGTGATAYKRGYLYTSNDGGVTWTKMNDLVASDLKKVQMIDVNNGFAVGSTGILLKTVDGGTTWDLKQQLYFQGVATFNDLYFISPTTGVIVGERGLNLLTLDGGLTFTSAGLSNVVFNYSTITHDGSNFYAIRNTPLISQIFKGTLIGTSITWTPMSSNRSTDLQKVHMVSGGSGFAIGVDGTLLKTINNGAVWTTVATGVSENFKDAYFKDMSNGVAIIDSVSGKGLIYKTTNGGETWTLLSAHNGIYYNSLQFYQPDKGYAVGNNNVVKRVVLSGSFGLVNIPKPNVSTNLAAAYFSDGDKGWVVGNSATIYYTKNGTANYPTWDSLSILGISAADADFKDVYFNATTNTGLLLSNSGKLFKITPTGASYTVNLTPLASNIQDIDEDNVVGGRAYAFDKTTGLKYIDKGSISTATALSSITNSAILPTAANVKSIFVKNANTVFVTGINGDIYRGDNVNSGAATWVELSKKILSLPLNDIQATGTNTIYAVGTEGSLLQTTNGADWKTLPTATTTNFNAIKFNPTNPALGLIAGDNGQLYKNTISGSVATLTAIPVPTSNHLYDIALNSSNLAYISGANGTVLSIPDVNINAPVASLAPLQPAESFRGIAFKFGTNQVFTVGDNSAIYTFNNTSGAKVKPVFTPALTDVHFANALNGYTVGEKDIIRHTANGGLTWKYIKPITNAVGQVGSIPALNGVWTTKMDTAIIIGDNGYVGKIVGTMLTYSQLGTNNLYDIALKSDTGYIVGQNGAAYETLNNGSTFAPMPIPPTLTPLRAVHIFSDKSVIAVGENAKVYYFNGTTWRDHSPISVTPSVIFTDVFFHDDRTGYVVGSGGTGVGSYVLRCGLETNIQTYTSPINWLSKRLNGINGVTSTTVNVVTIDFPTRYHGFLGGSFISGTPVNYARLINDESNIFSTRFYYDRLGRMVISQNTKQYNRKNTSTPIGLADFSYTLYDKLGRISEVGELTDNAGLSTNFTTIFGEYVNGQFNPNVINDAKLVAWITACSRREVTKTYYDNIAITGLPVTQQNLRKRVATVTYEDKFDGNDQTYDHATHYTYDIHGNVNTLLQDNKKLYNLGVANANVPLQAQRFKRVDYDYDLISGKVNVVRFQDGQPDAFYHFYEYDADNRITDVYTSKFPQANTLINREVVTKNTLWDLDVHYDYYAHGPLARVEYGAKGNKVQGTDYVYTLQGWIKGVNSNLLKAENDMGNDGLTASPHNQVAKDAFGYTLNYHADDYKPINSSKWVNAQRFEAFAPATSDLMAARFDLFNGNISSMVTTLSEPKIYTAAPNETPNILPQGTAYKYDQLNRLSEMKAFQNLDVPINKWGLASTYTGRYNNTFKYDANGNILRQLRADANGTVIDSLTYKYAKDATGHTKQNRLYNVNDKVNSTAFTDDIDDQVPVLGYPNNYSYDAIGNLSKDRQEEIDTIHWTVYGKIKIITRKTGSLKSDLEFNYDASGNRIAKIEKPRDASGIKPQSAWKTTYYARDGQGNVMGNYLLTNISAAPSFKLTERNLYGSSRLGSDYTEVSLIATAKTNPYNRTLGNKRFEGSNHLGNVLATFSDRKIPRDDISDGVIDYFQVDVLSANDYSPFGVILDGRTFGVLERYGFNGKEKDDEVKGRGDCYDFGARMLDSRLGRFLSLDGLYKNMPFQSPYSFAGNIPISAIDLNGDLLYVVIKGKSYDINAKEASGFRETSGYNTLIKTPSGKALIEKYAASNKTDIYLTEGTTSKVNAQAQTSGAYNKQEGIAMGFKNPGGAFDGFLTETTGKEVYLVTLNSASLVNDDTYEDAAVLFHEIKAHVDLDKVVQNKVTAELKKNPVGDKTKLTDKVSHEDEYGSYNSGYNGSILKTPSPAATIKKELTDLESLENFPVKLREMFYEKSSIKNDNTTVVLPVKK